MRSAAWALATSSRCSESVSAAIRVFRSFTSSRAGPARPPLAAARRPAGRGCATPPPPPGQPVRRPAGRTRRRRPPPRRHARAPPGPAARAPSPHARRRPRGGANPPVRERHWRVPRRCARPAGPPPRPPARPRPRRRLRAVAGSSARHPAPAARCAAGFELGQFARRCRWRAGLQLVALGHQPVPLLVGGAGILAEPAELFVDRRDRGVGLVERGQRLLGGVLAGGLLGRGPRQRRR